MPSALSIKLGDFLYKNAFPVYNIIYPFFKRRQDKHEIALLKKYIKKEMKGVVKDGEIFLI